MFSCINYLIYHLQILFLFATIPAFGQEIIAEDTNRVDFCSPEYDCGRDKNTACNCTESTTCQHNDERLYEFRKSVLHVHNDYRNLLANGSAEAQDYMIEEAANMQALNYDLGLEYLSRCHVIKCTTASDICRKTRNFESIGQNIARSEYKISTIHKDEIAIENWFMIGAKVVPRDIIDSYEDTGGK